MPVATSTDLIVLSAMPRSGTHFLRSAIANGADIVVLDEPFNPDLRGRSYRFEDFLRAEMAGNPGWRFNGATADSLLNRYFDRLVSEGKGKPVLADIKDDQLRCLDWPATLTTGVPRVLRHILTKGYPIIRLERRNLLAQYASVRRAIMTGEWVRTGGAGDKGPVLTLDYASARNHMVETAASARAVDGWIAGHKAVLPLAYETLIADNRLTDSVCAALSGFLGRDIADAGARMPSKLAPPLEEYVSNLQEIRTRLAAEGLAGLCDPQRDGKSVVARPVAPK